jgi:aspartyl-tRNA(Asn)/glutamyl-tRNA(Gln) amidotransferase subunit C
LEGEKMKVSAEEVKYIAQLSRLSVPETELQAFTEQFNQILNYADILQNLDSDGIEPSPYVLPVAICSGKTLLKKGEGNGLPLATAPL